MIPAAALPILGWHSVLVFQAPSDPVPLTAFFNCISPKFIIKFSFTRWLRSSSLNSLSSIVMDSIIALAAWINLAQLTFANLQRLQCADRSLLKNVAMQTGQIIFLNPKSGRFAPTCKDHIAGILTILISNELLWEFRYSLGNRKLIIWSKNNLKFAYGIYEKNHNN